MKELSDAGVWPTSALTDGPPSAPGHPRRMNQADDHEFEALIAFGPTSRGNQARPGMLGLSAKVRGPATTPMHRETHDEEYL